MRRKQRAGAYGFRRIAGACRSTSTLGRMKLTVSKALAATQQLDVAIELLFADREPLSVRTLASAAHGLLSDLVELKRPGASWREKLIQDSGLPRKQAVYVLHAASNFLKHADRDPNDDLSFEEEENDHVIFFSTLECGELGHPLSSAMQAFQIWYLACHPEQIGIDADPVRKAMSALPELSKQERQVQLGRGMDFLKAVLAREAHAA